VVLGVRRFLVVLGKTALLGAAAVLRWLTVAPVVVVAALITSQTNTAAAVVVPVPISNLSSRTRLRLTRTAWERAALQAPAQFATAAQAALVSLLLRSIPGKKPKLRGVV
jgi:hypothetical protein